MKHILLFSFFLVSTLLYSQDEKQRFEISQTKQLTSVAAYDKALDEMQSSADKSKTENIKQLDEQFELNFSEKAKLDAKLSSLLQKKIQAEDKFAQAKSETDKEKFKEKIKDFNLDLENVNKKLSENQIELKKLQKSYNKFNK